MSPRGTVELPRAVLLGLVTALVASLLTLAFLLGRGTRLGDSTPRPAAQEAVDGTVAPSAAEPAIAPGQAPPEPPLAAPIVSQEAPAPGSMATSAPPPGATGTGERAAVAAYFAALDAVESKAKIWSDPQQMAFQLVQQTLTGDRSGFDRLIAAQREAQGRIAALTPPAICREYHAQVVQLMGESLALLEALGAAANTADPGALEAFTSKATDIETRARRVDALGAELKRRVGL